MSTITLPNIRVSSDLTVKVRLKDSGVAIDWSTLTKIKASIYSDAQRALAGRCDVSIDAEDSTLLVCNYAANKPQYVGVNRIVVSAKYMGETKTYDKPAFTFVRWTADQEGEQITIDDPDVDVEISVEDISSSILQEAVDAAFEAADRANDAAAAAEHMVDIHTGPEGKSAYEVAVEEGYVGTEEEWLASLVGPQGAQGIQGETGEAAGFGTVSVSLQEDGGQPSATVAASGTDTAKNFAFTFNNLKGEKGDKGDQGNSGYTGAAGELEVVNNLTDGGSTAALSAEMGKTLEGEVSQLEAEVNGFPRVDIDLSEYPSTLGIISSSTGKWYVPTVNNYHKAIPVSPGERYTIVANDTYATVYALLKSYSTPINDSTPDYCDNETGTHTILKEESGTITIPEDCAYIVLNVEMSSQNRTPSSFFRPAIEGAISELQEQIDEINDSLEVRATTDITDTLSSGYIATNGDIGTVVSTTVVSNAGFLHKIVQVSKGDVAIIKGLGAGAPRLWCFTDSEYKILSHADAATSISTDTPFVADSDGYFIFNTYNNVSYGFSLTAKSGETYMEKVDQLAQEVAEKLDRSEIALSQSVDFDSGYFLNPSGALNPAPIATSQRRYTTNKISGGFTIVLKPDWYLRSLNKYDKYGNFLENIVYGSDYVGTVTITDDGNSHYFQFDAQYSESGYPTTVISPISSISFAKTKVDAGANFVDLHPQKFGELDLSFDIKNVAPDYPAQPRINGLSNLLALWDDIVTNYGGTKADAGTEAGLTAPEYMADAEPIYVYKFLSNQSINDQSKHIKVLIYAGEHVNEYLGHNILLEFMRRICEDWATDHNCELLRSMVDWYVLPCINPYGYDFKNSRTNYNGVNIDRNFAASNWKSGEVGDDYGGPSAASEYETKVVQYFVETIKPDIMMDVHTGGTNSFGSLGSLEMSVDDLTYNKMDFYKLASTICRTASNLFVMGNTNYPQNLVTPLLDTNVQLKSTILALGTSNIYTGLSHQYAMEQGVKLALLIELNQVSKWVNGVYSASSVGDQADTSAKLARADLLFLTDAMYRAVKAISQNIE